MTIASAIKSAEKMRPELKSFLCGVSTIPGVWASVGLLRIDIVRAQYDAGTCEIAQARIPEGFALWAIPRKSRAKRYESQKLGRWVIAK